MKPYYVTQGMDKEYPWELCLRWEMEGDVTTKVLGKFRAKDVAEAIVTILNCAEGM